MITAGLLLATIGGADLIRTSVRRRRWIGDIVLVVLVLAVGILCAEWIAAAVSVLLAVVWVWAMPLTGRLRASVWPAVVLAVLCVAAVVLLPGQEAGWMLAGWSVHSPAGSLSAGTIVLAVGVVVFLVESGNLVVRAALAGEHLWRAPGESHSPGTAVSDDGVGNGRVSGGGSGAVRDGAFRGGRLIGPLERLLIVMLSLTGDAALIAAVLAAKGIVRFPEISRDGETGVRAEYFLVGSLVSWVMAFGGALLIWWSFRR